MKRKRKATITCPGCGMHIAGFPSSAPAVGAKRNPASALIDSGVLVPLEQSVISSLWVGVPAAIATSLIPGAEWAKMGVFAGVICGGLVWRWAVKEHSWRLTYELERRFGMDLDGDGVVGDPEKQTEPPPTKAPDVWVPHKEPGRKAPHWKRHSIPWTNRREARMVARAVVKWGKPFSRRALVGMNVLPDDPEHYQAIYQAMIKDELLVKGNTTPTEKGTLYLRGCLGDPPTPGAK